MLLYQKEGYSWVGKGLELLQSDTSLAAVTPRIAPPDSKLATKPTHYRWPEVKERDGGWIDSWFSTRCFLL